MKISLFLARITPLLLFLAAVPLCAQPDDHDTPGRKRIEDLRHMKLIESLDLNEEQSIRYFAREKDFRQNEKALGEQKHEIINRLKTLVKNNGSEADINKEIASLNSVGSEFIQKRFDFVMSLKDILSIKQIAKLLIFEDAFAKELRTILQNARRGARFKD